MNKKKQKQNKELFPHGGRIKQSNDNIKKTKTLKLMLIIIQSSHIKKNF